MRNNSSRSWNCPCISPHTVTGHRTGCTFDSTLNISLAFVHSSCTSASGRYLQFMSCVIHPSTLLTSAVPAGPKLEMSEEAPAPAGIPAVGGARQQQAQKNQRRRQRTIVAVADCSNSSSSSSRYRSSVVSHTHQLDLLLVYLQEVIVALHRSSCVFM